MNTAQFRGIGQTGNQWAYSLDNGCTFRVCANKEHALEKAMEAIDHRHHAGTMAKFILLELTHTTPVHYTAKGSS